MENGVSNSFYGLLKCNSISINVEATIKNDSGHLFKESQKEQVGKYTVAGPFLLFRLSLHFFHFHRILN